MMYDDEPGGPPAGCGPAQPGASRGQRPVRQQVFEHVRAQGEAARAEVARALGISAASVTAITADLIAAGFLREVEGGRDPSRPAPRALAREPARGRPPVALEVVPETRQVIGIKLAEERNSGRLADLAGGTVADATLPGRPGRRTPAELADEVAALVAALRAQAPNRRVDAVGLGLPGLVDHRAGRVAWSPLLGETDVALKALLESRLRLPVHVDNDSNVLALAELWFGVGRALPDFAVVTIEQGVGMGLVLGSQLFRGTRGMGLELGHTKVRLDGALCRCGQRGCLEAYVADYALAREASTALERDPRAPEGTHAVLDALFREAKDGHAAARSIFERAGRHLAMGLANVVQLFDPELIILSGERMRYDYLYADEVLAEMRDLTLLQGRTPARVEIHAWGDLVWAQGAVALALGAVTDEAMAA